MPLLDSQVHHDTHAIPMGNYVIAVGISLIVSPSEVGNCVIADKARERGGRVPGFSTGVQTDILVSSQPFRVLRRRSRQAARPVSTTAYPHSTANPVHRPS